MGITTEGQKYILSSFFRQKATPLKFYVRLTSGLTKTSKYADVSASEIVASSYAPYLIKAEASASGWWSLSQVSDRFSLTSRRMDLYATPSGWAVYKQMALCTASDGVNGTLICYDTIATDGQSISVGVKKETYFVVRLG